MEKIHLASRTELKRLPAKELVKLWDASAMFYENVQAEIYRRENIRIKKIEKELSKESDNLFFKARIK